MGWGSGAHFILELCVVCMVTIKSRLWTPGEAPEGKEENQGLGCSQRLAVSELEAAEHGRVGLSSRPLQAFCLRNQRLSLGFSEAPLPCPHRPGECLARCVGDTSSSSGKGVF